MPGLSHRPLRETMTGQSLAGRVMPSPAGANLTLWLYRNSGYVFLALTACAVLAFWPRYLARPFAADIRLHVHAAALAAWCTLLIAQSFLIRAGRRRWHGRLGQLSYVVGPAVPLSILVLNHHRAASGELAGFRLWLFTSNIGDAVLFFVCWTLAMANLKRPTVHARYMMCTAVTFIPPVFDRLFSRYAMTPQIANILPTVGGQPFAILPSFLMVFIILAAFSWWDWRSARRSTVFAKMFVVFALFYAAPLGLMAFPFWQRFVAVYVSMPFS